MLRHDQAEGLRRLLAPARPRVIAFCGAEEGVGRASALLNVAVALAHHGREVMVLDAPARGLAAALGLRRGAGRAPRPEDAVLRGPGGIGIVAGVPEAGAGLGATPDALLIHAPRGAEAALLARDGDRADVVVVTTARPAAITGAYALIKRLAAEAGARHFHVLVNRAEGARQAAALVGNLARVARQFLAVSLEPVGWVPADPKLGQAARLRLAVVEAFPAAPAARAYNAIAAAVAAWPQPDSDGGAPARLIERLLRPGGVPDTILEAA